MSDRIEEAARIIGSFMSRWDMDGRPDVPGGVDAHLAQMLAEAGLLATREEWATRDESDGPTDPLGWKGAMVEASDETEARDRSWSFGYTVYRRFVSEWEAME